MGVESQTVTLFPTSTILLPICTAALSFPKSTWCVPTIKFQCHSRTALRLSLPHFLVFLSLSECLLARRMLLKLSCASSIKFCAAFRSVSHTYDILVVSHNAAKHLDHLQQVFICLQEHGLQIHPDKCVLGPASLDFLGFHVDQHGIRPLDDKVQVLKDFPLPPTQCKLRRYG